MALLFTEDFEDLNGNINMLKAKGWAGVTPAWHFIESSIVRSGSYAMRVGDRVPEDSIARRFVPGAPAVVGVGFSFHLQRLPEKSGTVMADFRDSDDTINVSIACRPSGHITIIRGDLKNGVKLATSSESVITPRSWQHIEVNINIGPSFGTVEVRVEGKLAVSSTGNNISDELENLAGVDGKQNVGYVGFPGGTNVSIIGTLSDADAYYDDIYVYDSTPGISTWTGDLQIETLRPSADTAVAEWTGSYTDIDDVEVDGDATFIYSGSGSPSAVTSQFEMDNVSSTVGAVLAIESSHFVRNDGSGGTSFQDALVSSGVVGVGSTVIASPNYEYVNSVWYVDPNTGVEFTGTNVNNIKLQVSGG